MKFEIRTIKIKYDKYNAELFDSKLPPSNQINFEFFKSKNAIAMIRYPISWNRDDAVTFRLNSLVEFETEQSLNHTIIHEMIHVSQFYNRASETGHGRDFKRIANEIYGKSHGLFNITRVHYGEVEMIAKQKTNSNIIEDCIVVVTDNNSFRVYKNTSLERIKSQMLLFSCNQEYFKYSGTLFNTYNSSRSNICTSVSFQKNVNNIVEEMKKTAEVLLKRTII